MQRHDTLEAIWLSPGRIAGGCDLLHFLESTAGQRILVRLHDSATASPGCIDFCIDLVVAIYSAHHVLRVYVEPVDRLCADEIRPSQFLS